MPKYYWKFEKEFSTGCNNDVYIQVDADTPSQARSILVNHIIKMTRYGMPRLFKTSKGNILISQSNDARVVNLPYIDIDYSLFQKILCFTPNVIPELNHLAQPFIPGSNP
jgi:hypothetical protein